MTLRVYAHALEARDRALARLLGSKVLGVLSLQTGADNSVIVEAATGSAGPEPEQRGVARVAQALAVVTRSRHNRPNGPSFTPRWFRLAPGLRVPVV